jgi:hypothetical protein
MDAGLPEIIGFHRLQDGPRARMQIRKRNQFDPRELPQNEQRLTLNLPRCPQPSADPGQIRIIVTGMHHQFPCAGG